MLQCKVEIRLIFEQSGFGGRAVAQLRFKSHITGIQEVKYQQESNTNGTPPLYSGSSPLT